MSASTPHHALEERYVRSYLAMTLPSAFPQLAIIRLDLQPHPVSRNQWRLTLVLSDDQARTAAVITDQLTDETGKVLRNTVSIEWDEVAEPHTIPMSEANAQTSALS